MRMAIPKREREKEKEREIKTRHNRHQAPYRSSYN